MAYKTKYKPANTLKYKGDSNNICCRSLWERWLCKYFDFSDSIQWWSSEELFIKYYDISSGSWHRYYPDFIIHLQSGQTIIIEVKPKHQTKEPIKSFDKRKNKRFLTEMVTYKKNISKWKFAKEFADKNGMIFQVWTEDTLRRLGAPKDLVR